MSKGRRVLLLGLVVLGGVGGGVLLRGRKKPDVPYVPTPHEVVDAMLEMAGVGPSDVVYDLGCGDGRIVVRAAQRFGARGVGVDIEPKLVRQSRENARRAGVEENVRFFCQDLFQTEVREATVVTLFLLPDVNLRLRPKLFRELRPGARVVSHKFPMGEWEPDRRIRVKAADGERSLFLWVMPAAVGGVWEMRLQDRLFTLRLHQRFQRLSGSLRDGGREEAIAEGRVEGEEVHFQAPCRLQGRTLLLRFQGRVQGEQMEGKAFPQGGEEEVFFWSAWRRAVRPEGLWRWEGGWLRLERREEGFQAALQGQPIEDFYLWGASLLLSRPWGEEAEEVYEGFIEDGQIFGTLRRGSEEPIPWQASKVEAHSKKEEPPCVFEPSGGCLVGFRWSPWALWPRREGLMCPSSPLPTRLWRRC